MKLLLASLALVLCASVSLAQCPNCPGPVCPVPPRPLVGPQEAADYNAFHAAIMKGGKGLLYVGTTPPCDPTGLRCVVSPGFGGLANGTYRCMLTRAGPYVFPVPTVVPDKMPLAKEGCDCCKPTCTCEPGKKNPDCVCYPCKCNK